MKKITEQNGQNGQPKNCFGKDGKDIYIKVPLGSQINHLKSKKILFDVMHNHQNFVLAYNGGYDNSFLSLHSIKTHIIWKWR